MKCLPPARDLGRPQRTPHPDRGRPSLGPGPMRARACYEDPVLPPPGSSGRLRGWEQLGSGALGVRGRRLRGGPAGKAALEGSADGNHYPRPLGLSWEAVSVKSSRSGEWKQSLPAKWPHGE